jgi:hypothetical protein
VSSKTRVIPDKNTDYERRGCADESSLDCGQSDAMSLDLDTALQEIQRILKRHPVLVVGTGASCALDPRFGMEALEKELERKLEPGAHEGEWKQALARLHAKQGLEEALNVVTEPGLRGSVITATGAFVASVDKDWAWRVATGEKLAPLNGLLRKLLDGLPPSNPVLDLVTPNYDMLIEHTCDALSIPWTDGFATGSVCRWDWDAALDSMLTFTREPRGRKWAGVRRFRPHVRLHKVHGSISWLQSEDGVRLVRSERTTDGSPPASWRRAMITPGRAKLEDVGMNRQWFAKADAAIAEASAFLIVGYGFNDVHIQDGMRKRLFIDGCAGIVVTRDWSTKIEKWVRDSSDLWAVCQNPEGGKSGTIIGGPGNVDAPLVCDGRNLWDIASFADAVM